MTTRRKPTAEHRPDGWPLDAGQYDTTGAPHPGFKLCTGGLARAGRVCDGLPVWRIRTYGRGYVATGYLCARCWDAS